MDLQTPPQESPGDACRMRIIRRRWDFSAWTMKEISSPGAKLAIDDRVDFVIIALVAGILIGWAITIMKS